jgi:hypothetical protein
MSEQTQAVETTATEAVTAEEKPFQPLHRAGYGVGVDFGGAHEDHTNYHLYAQDPDGGWKGVAFITVDHETRSIAFSDPALTKTIETKGIASWMFDGETGSKRISGRSVAGYVLPRAAVLLARLYAIA